MQRKRLYPSEKIVSRETLTEIVRELKQQGKTIVTTNGSFDLLHIGHIAMLQEAKSLGDVLIIGLNSDASIQAYKGKYRPLCPQEHRAGMLAALACTDYITIFDELTPIELLKVIQPHIHVNSPEHGKECVERKVVEQHGGRIHLAQLVEGMSTTQLIDRILEVSSHTPCRGIFFNATDLFELDTTFSAVDNISGKLKFALLSRATINALREFSTLGFLIFILMEESIRRQYEQIQEAFRKNEIENSRFLFYPQGSDNLAQQMKRTLIEQAVADFDVMLAKSFVISGDMSDIQIGRDINCKTILLAKHSTGQKNISGAAGPHFVAEDLQKIVNFLF